MHHIRGKCFTVKGSDRQADTIDRNAVSDMHILKHLSRRNCKYCGMCAFCDLQDRSHLLYDSCKHPIFLLFSTGYPSISQSDPSAVIFVRVNSTASAGV